MQDVQPMYPYPKCGDTFNCTILYGYSNIYYLPVDWFGKSQHISLGSVEFHKPLIATCCIMHKRSRYLEPTAKRV